jgi:Flp pilus assembly protein TadD
LNGLRLAIVVMTAMAAGCAQDPVAEKLSTHEVVRSGEPSGSAMVATLMRVAAATEQTGDFATAASFYRRAHVVNVQLGRKDAAPLVGLGRTLLALGAHNEASETFRAALDISPDEPQALRGIGNALIAMDQPMAAITNLEAALAKMPDVQTYSSLGVAYDLLDRRAAAQAAYRKGLALDAGNMALRNNLGLSLAFSGEFDEAIAMLERTAADPRATLRQKLNLALAHGLAGEFAVAEEILGRYLDAPAVANNIAYYKTLRALQNRKLAARSVGIQAGAAPAPDVANAPSVAETAPPPPPPQSASAAEIVDAPAPAAEVTPPDEPATGKPVNLVPEPPPVAASAAEPPTSAPAAATSMAEPSSVPPKPEGPAEPPRTARKPAAGKASQVQFAAFRTKEKAEESWRRLVATAPEILAGIAPVIESGLSGADPNPYWRVRSAPFATRAEAAELCARLKERGVDCMLVRDAATLAPQ